MGSGKSYEVTSNVILNAIKQGRRIVTNIDGIHQQKIHDYLTAEFGLNEWGHILTVSNDTVLSPNFWYYGRPKEGDTLVKPGDMVVLDECWRFCGAGVKLDPHLMIFTREHRHFIDDRQFTCDLVLICQDISDLHRSVKNVVELTFITHKLKTLGLNKTYRLTMYEGYKTRGKAIKEELKKYNPKFFEFYSSYSGGQGNEVPIDKRQNVLNSWKVFVAVPATFLLFVFSVWYLFNWFSKSHTPKNQNLTASQQALNPNNPATLKTEIPKQKRLIATPEIQNIVGYIKQDQSIIYYVDIGNGQIQSLYDVPACSAVGNYVYCLIDETHILSKSANNQQIEQKP
jgi:zona occludens toxin